MVIAAHFLAASLHESFLFSFLNLLASQKREQQFVFFIEEQNQATIHVANNVKLVIVRPSIKSGLILQYWYRFKLAKQLKKYAVDIFLTDSGALCEGVALPQLAWVEDIGFLQKQQVSKSAFSRHWRRNFSNSFKKSARVLVPQPFIKTALDAHYTSEPSKVAIIYPGVDENFIPITEDQRQLILEKTSEGFEYFLCAVDEHSAGNLMTVLKAYSIFKKRQKSSMKLLLLLHGIELPRFVKDFHLYKYRHDVIIRVATEISELPKLLAGAYAAIYLPTQITKSNLEGLQALQSGVPLIVSDLNEANLVFEDSVLYSHISESQLAEQMMNLYKDEAKRKEMISAGREHAKRYNWEQSCEELWQTILWHASYKAH